MLSLKSVQYYFKDINLSSTKWRKKISVGGSGPTGAALNRLCVLWLGLGGGCVAWVNILPNAPGAFSIFLVNKPLIFIRFYTSI